MSDPTDKATDLEEAYRDKATDLEEAYRDKAIQNTRSDIPKGKKGDCDFCGEWSGRLIKGACAPCRDKYKLP